MSAEATAYPKLFKIYKELKRQNKIIFEAEKERNALELERDALKGLAKFTKKGIPPKSISYLLQTYHNIFFNIHH